MLNKFCERSFGVLWPKENMKLLIVDDEITTRNGLIKHIHWDKLGITHIKEASDGQEAIELLEEFVPDILITDIRMPRMNGIELATYVKEKHHRIKVIFLSGYSDKEYLKAAIHLGVINYVEKPIDLQEMEDAVVKAVNLFKEESKKEIEIEQSVTVKTELVERLIRNSDDFSDSLLKLKRLGLFIDEKTPLVVLLIKVKQSKLVMKELQVLIEQGIGHHLEPQKSLGAVKDENHLIWILSLKEREIKRTTQAIIDTINETTNGFMKPLFWSVGSPVIGVKNLYESYQTAAITLQSLFYKGYGSLAFYTKVNSTTELSGDEILKEFASILQVADYSKLKDYINQLFSRLYWQQNLLVNDVKNIVFQLSQLLYKEGETRVSFQRKDLEEREPYLWEKIFQIETIAELKDFMESELEMVMGAIHAGGQYSKSVLVVKKIIESKYMDKTLSTKSLADQVYLTNTYLSSLFKKEIGITISEYIMQIRMEESKVFLKELKWKLSDVAAKVGYSDANYYAKTFKKYSGVTPSEYREMQML